LKKEIKLFSPLTSHLATTSLCIGGGTPNILKEKELEGILLQAHKFMNLEKDAEMGIELYPDDSVYASKLKLLKRYRINRISLGIQSFDNRIKKICNRFDSREQNIKVFETARKLGFNNINFDLIFGLPNQTRQSFSDTLSLAVKLYPEQISMYPLAARHSQILFYKYTRKRDVQDSINTFDFARDFLAKKGYAQISRYWYMKRGAGVRYKYNECCSDLMPWLGLGLNSISYYSNFTYKNTPVLEKYLTALERGKLPVEKGYAFGEKDTMRNYVIRKMNYSKVGREGFKKIFREDLIYIFRRIIKVLKKFDLVDVNKEYLALTARGIFYEALVKRCFYAFGALRKKEAFYRD